jgi:hypothetical protein
VIARATWRETRRESGRRHDGVIRVGRPVGELGALGLEGDDGRPHVDDSAADRSDHSDVLERDDSVTQESRGEPHLRPWKSQAREVGDRQWAWIADTVSRTRAGIQLSRMPLCCDDQNFGTLSAGAAQAGAQKGCWAYRHDRARRSGRSSSGNV